MENIAKKSATPPPKEEPSFRSLVEKRNRVNDEICAHLSAELQWQLRLVIHSCDNAQLEDRLFEDVIITALFETLSKSEELWQALGEALRQKNDWTVEDLKSRVLTEPPF